MSRIARSHQGRIPRYFALAFCVLIAPGCRSATRFEPEPLHPADVLAQLHQERDVSPTPGGTPTLAEATAAMQATNPRIRKARAEHFAAQHVSNTKTPHPNPVIDFSPLAFTTGDFLSSAGYGVAAALGWQFLLADTPKLRDDINAELTRRAFVNAAATEREEYLALRADFVTASVAAIRLEIHERLGAEADAIAAVARQLVDAGTASSVDARLIALDADRVGADVIGSSEQAADARTLLAARMGRGADQVVAPLASALPTLPETLPDTETLFDLAIAQHPDLDRIRAAYRVTELELRMELADRLPDVFMGLDFEDEDDGSVRYGLPLSIEIPIFERNQPGIARMQAERVRLRAAFRARLTEILNAVETTHRRVERRQARLARLESVVVPRAQETLAATRSAVENGTTDALRYIDVMRTAREVELDQINARAELLGAWSELELAVGAPLLGFPDEPGNGFPAPAPEDDGGAK